MDEVNLLCTYDLFYIVNNFEFENSEPSEVATNSSALGESSEVTRNHNALDSTTTLPSG